MFQSTFAPRLGKLTLATSLAIAVTACGGGGGGGTPAGSQIAATLDQDLVNAVVQNNADIAFAAYSDSLTTAEALQAAINTFVGNPSLANLEAARDAWLASREPYGQTEVYRFREGPIDALDVDSGIVGMDGDGPEGRINGWPLGEALIDYVAAVGTGVDGDDGSDRQGPDMDDLFAVSLIENFAAVTIDDDTLVNNFELGMDERYVTTGYHAIEFLLWGQDTNTDSPLIWSSPRDANGGQRPVTDYSTTPGTCTSGVGNVVADMICQRRGAYLQAAAQRLITDLQAVVTAWNPAGDGNHYDNFIAGGETSLAAILEGMGRLSAGELAGERINIAATQNSQEDEHSCFSDNTDRDIFLNALGVQNSYLGRYVRAAGVASPDVDGTGIDELLAQSDAVSASNSATATQLTADLEATQTAAQVLVTSADNGTPFDNIIQDSPAMAIAVVEALVAQTNTIQTAIDGLLLTAGNLEQDTGEDIFN